MALTNTRLGADDGGSDNNALFLKQFAGEVLTAFNTTNIFGDLHMTREIENGKSAQFPVTGRLSAGYHTPGTPLDGSTGGPGKHSERVIKVDEKLVSDVFIPDIDELKNHYDVRSIYSEEMGRALAKEYDTRVARVILLAARASANLSQLEGGTKITNANAKTDANALANILFDGAQKLDEKFVPEDGRVMALKPAQYYLLVQSDKVVNRDFGGSGSRTTGAAPMVAGIEVRKSNNIPQDNYSGVSGENNDYSGDFTNVVGPIFHSSCAGTVRLRGLQTQMTSGDFEVQHQGTLMVGKYLVGHGVLRPEASIEVATA